MNLSFKDLLFDPNLPLKTQTHLSKKEAQADLEMLHYALTRAYPACWKMNSDEWARILETLQNITLPESIDRREFGSMISDILWDIPDGHLKVRFGSETLGAKFHKNLRQVSTGSNVAGTDVWKIEMHDSPRGSIPVFGISRYPQSSEPHWQGFLEAVKHNLKASALVIDLRGNDGGDDTKAIEMTSLLLGHDLHIDWVREVICESAEAYALQINTYSKIIWINYDSKSLEAPAELKAHLEYLKTRASELQGQKPQKTIHKLPALSKKSLGAGAFNKPIYVLIDAETRSSGEWTVLYLKQHPQTVVVGDNTFGMIHFGNSGQLLLPYSQLTVALCMKINELISGEFYEKIGIPPTIRVSNEDSLKYTLTNLIK
ncbi:S41 family peptidase [Bdellovibrio sp. HCB337]|uniref:S41 family peptidase n=1 Tax=Bdellovibrio sp. HCB337 TaxID=3394358 RepID=UPI0039A6263E